VRVGHIESAADRPPAQQDVKDVVSHLPLFDGHPRMRAIRSVIESIADTDTTVLIRGESGVGKDLVARAVHAASTCRHGPFIKVNCAAIPQGLLESELFGHEKGAFTGASGLKQGKFELADGGTLFLDEIGELSPSTQARLLRVVQEREFERLGGTSTIGVDVRLITATNKDLERAQLEGTFREDLYYRLNVFTIWVPPLRERADDVPVLVEHFVKQFCAENNFRTPSFAPAALEALKRHPWRGNVRELKNAVERLLIMIEDDEIRPEHLADVLRRAGDEPASPASTGTLRDFKETAERTFLVGKLKENAWNISATAAAIGTPRSNLYKKLEQYEISQEKDG